MIRKPLDTLCIQDINDLHCFGAPDIAIIELCIRCGIRVRRRQRLALAGWHANLLGV